MPADASAGGEVQGAIAVAGLALHERASAAAGYGARTGDARDLFWELGSRRHVVLSADFLASRSSQTATNQYLATLSVTGGSDPVLPIVGFNIEGGGMIARGVGGCGVTLSRFNGVDGNEVAVPPVGQALGWDVWHHVEVAIDLARGAYTYIDVDGQRAYILDQMLPRAAVDNQWVRGETIDRMATGIVSLPGAWPNQTDDDVYWDNVELRFVDNVAGAPEPAETGVLALKIAPNPFNAATSLQFALDAEAEVAARIYDVRGRLVRDLQPGRLGAGAHRIDWDGRDERGATVATGVYLVRVQAGGGEPGTARLVLVK